LPLPLAPRKAVGGGKGKTGRAFNLIIREPAIQATLVVGVSDVLGLVDDGQVEAGGLEHGPPLGARGGEGDVVGERDAADSVGRAEEGAGCNENDVYD
jgi:hypothetical protein